MKKNDKKIVFSQLVHFINNILPLYFEKIKHFSIKEIPALDSIALFIYHPDNTTQLEKVQFYISDETSVEIHLEIPHYKELIITDFIRVIDLFFERKTPSSTATYNLYYILTPKDNYKSLFKDLYIPVDNGSCALLPDQEITGIRRNQHTVLSVLDVLKKEKLNHKIVICSIVDNDLDHLEQKTPIYDMNTLPFTGVSSYLNSKIINVMQMKDPFKESVLNILIISGAENNE